jgi:hypothetical protein
MLRQVPTFFRLNIRNGSLHIFFGRQKLPLFARDFAQSIWQAWNNEPVWGFGGELIYFK